MATHPKTGQEVGWKVAVIHNGMPGDTLDTEAANARLIAAAPELLAVCKAFWVRYNNRVVNGSVFDDIAQQAIAAIARAEGGT